MFLKTDGFHGEVTITETIEPSKLNCLNEVLYAFEQSNHAYATFNLPNLSVRLMHMNAPKIYSNGNVGQHDLSLCKTGMPFAITTAADLTVCLSNSISLSGSVLQIAPVP